MSSILIGLDLDLNLESIARNILYCRNIQITLDNSLISILFKVQLGPYVFPTRFSFLCHEIP